MILALLGQIAIGGTLPGLSLEFTTDAAGHWVLPAELPETLAAAGAKPGWQLVSVDGLAFTDPLAVRREVARGPAREIRLHLQPKGGAETILVTWRAPLAQAEWVETLPWPADFSGDDAGWVLDDSGQPGLVDGAGAVFPIEPAQGLLVSGGSGDLPAGVSELFWALSDATWTVSRFDAVSWGNVDLARKELEGAARVSRWKDAIGDHLLVPTHAGIEVFTVEFPRGTALLPTCNPRVPETCLASGRQIVEQLGDRPGARAEANRQLSLACSNGVYGACFEAIALVDPSMTAQARACLDERDLPACNAVARSGLEFSSGQEPDDALVGMLEYACTLEGSGTLGQRLRRLEEVGEGCVMLSDAYDALKNPGQALLALDQACVLGRADACERASERRASAFAARTVRECENDELAIAPACVEQGRLLQNGPIPTATLDEFGAFLRGCALGSAEGCLALGDYVDRWGIDNERVVKAETELRASCGDNELRACLGAGHLLVRHDPSSDAYGEALVLFDRACEGGLSPGCIAGARQRRIRAARSVEAPDQAEMWESACTLNDPDGCAGLGERQSRRKETWIGAFEAWSRACDLGSAHSCSELGRLVERSNEPLSEAEQTREIYLTRGCDNGDPKGCFWLADDQMEPRVQPSEATYLLLEKSCDGDDGEGCAALAQVHLDRKTSFDDEIAARHLDSACANGDYDSCKVLGTMYLRGKGVERDRQRANELLERFRANAPKRHVRLGASIGLPNVAGGELELVTPIPVGPALSVVGQYTYLPKAGTVLHLLEGGNDPSEAPDLTVRGAALRLYPNNTARGAYGSVSLNDLRASGGSIGQDKTRFGWSARVGMRNDTKGIYTGMELGLGQYGLIYRKDFDEESTGIIPLIVPTFAFSIGAAFL